MELVDERSVSGCGADGPGAGAPVTGTGTGAGWLAAHRCSRTAAWDTLQAELAVAIVGLEEGHRLVLRTRAPGGPRLELAVDGTRMRATIPTGPGTGDWAMPDRLAGQRLRRAGWHPPCGPDECCLTFDGPSQPGWRRDVDPAATPPEIAGMATTVVRDAFGVPLPSWLVYQGFTRDGAEVVFGGLGLERVPLHPVDLPLANRVDGVLAELLHVDELIHDEDGDVPVRRDTAMYYVRANEARRTVTVFSPMLRDVTVNAALVGRLNELNAEATYARTFVKGTTVMVAAEVDGGEALAPGLERACDAVSWLADHWGPRLQREFGGSTFFESEDPSPGEAGPPVGLYL